jgi:tetratricopeptide (TPR) repeat protein
MKAAAIANEFPEAALALCDERIRLGDEDDCFGAAYSKALINARIGRIEDMFASLEEAIGADGFTLGAAAAGEYCCLVAFYGRTDLYLRAVQILDALDAEAQQHLGRPFRSFPTYAARALIHYKSGRKSEAAELAKVALQLALEQTALILGVPGLGPAPGFPSPLHDALLVVAGMWNETELGPPPEV